MTDLHPKIEAPIIFACSLYFVNSQGNFTEMTFGYSPGVYPSKEIAVPTIQQAQKEALTALKLKSKDLSWRLPTANEFVTFTSQGKLTHAFASKYQEPYSVILELLDGTEKNIVGVDQQPEGVPEGDQPQRQEGAGVDKEVPPSAPLQQSNIG